MNRRQRMYKSNDKAREFLIKNGYDQIWLKAHTRRQDTIFTQHYNYKATDLWNLFDGICFKDGHLYFLQIKTDAWPPLKPIFEFKSMHYPMGRVLLANVKKKKNRIVVVTRLV